MSPPDHDAEVKSAVAIALLQQNYMHLEEKMDTQHADTKSDIGDIKKDISELRGLVSTLVAQNAESRTRNKIHGAIWTAARHGVTMVLSSALTMYVANKLHIPINLEP